MAPILPLVAGLKLNAYVVTALGTAEVSVSWRDCKVPAAIAPTGIRTAPKRAQILMWVIRFFIFWVNIFSYL